MITFSRSGTKVLVYIEIGMNTCKELTATIECGGELYAELLRNEVQEKFANKMEKIRKIEYLRGRRREKKQDYFWYTMDTTDYPREKEQKS